MLLMVDWITGHIEPRQDLVGFRPWEELKGRFDTGKVLRVKPGGEFEWEVAARLPVVGSHDNKITVRSTTGFNLEVSGNPVKFLQGHNLFGSDDYLALFFAAGQEVRKIAGEFPSPGTWDSFKMQGPRISRLDVTRSYRFATQGHARAWIRDVAAVAHTRHRGGSLFKDGTVTLGAKSNRWKLVIYAKADEIQAQGKTHRLLSFDGKHRRELEDWAQGVVRFEVRIFGKELQKWSDLTPGGLPRLWQHYFDSVTWNRNRQIAYEGLDMADRARVDQAARGYLARWKCGEDLRPPGGLSKPTFYRWRRRLLETFGVDIAESPVVNVKPEDVVELDPAGWDPDPIASKFHRPDSTLPLRYPSHG